MHIVRFVGGLGNQLFQLQLYESLIEQYGAEKVFADISFYDSTICHVGFELSDKIALNTIRNIPRKRIVIDETTYDRPVNNDKIACYYDGYWQSTSFFPRTRSLVGGYFAAIELDDRNQKCLYLISGSAEPVSVHVRRGDYVDHFLHGNIANRAYYQNAIDYVREHFDNTSFFVFSDDIEWCRTSLDFGENGVTFIDWNKDDVSADIVLMSNCRINIISNSSFSWWAQYINTRDDKVVIAPEYWFNDESDKHHPETDAAVHIPNYNIHEVCEKPYYSIIIPAYNSEFVIRRCLSSVLGQTFENYEVIIVDDGSTDNTRRVIADYSNRDKRVRLIEYDENRSLLAARISGMKEATGKYVLFVDSDDYVDERMCGNLYEHLSKKSADIVEYSYITEPDKAIVSGNLVTIDPEDILYGRHFETVWNKCYSRRLIKDVLGQIESFYCNMGEDGFFTTVFFANSNSFYRIDDILYHYVDIGGMSNNNKDIAVDQHIMSLMRRDEHLRRFADTNGTISVSGIRELFTRDVRSVAVLCVYSDNSFQTKKENMQKIDEMCGVGMCQAYLASKRGLIDAIKAKNPMNILDALWHFIGRKVRGNLYTDGI